MGFDPEIVATLNPADGSFEDMRTISRYRDEQHDNYRGDSPVIRAAT